MNLAKIFRKVQKLKSSSNPEDFEELDFYEAVIKLLMNSFTPNLFLTIEEIQFSLCPLDKAKKLAHENGLHVIEGYSGAIYLSWVQGINDLEN